MTEFLGGAFTSTRTWRDLSRPNDVVKMVRFNVQMMLQFEHYFTAAQSVRSAKRLTLRRCDDRIIQWVHDAGVIFTKRQVFYQVGHVYLQSDGQKDEKRQLQQLTGPLSSIRVFILVKRSWSARL